MEEWNDGRMEKQGTSYFFGYCLFPFFQYSMLSVVALPLRMNLTENAEKEFRNIFKEI